MSWSPIPTFLTPVISFSIHFFLCLTSIRRFELPLGHVAMPLLLVAGCSVPILQSLLFLGLGTISCHVSRLSTIVAISIKLLSLLLAIMTSLIVGATSSSFHSIYNHHDLRLRE